MTLKYKLLPTIFLFIFSFLNAAQQKPTLIFYCGITMVKPMEEIAKIIEKEYNCVIKISQGGSKDLYDSLKYSKKGDLYLPGSESYVTNNLKDGFFLRSEYIGYNQASIFVQKGNPLNIKSLNDFKNDNYSFIISNPNSGSIGKMTKAIFIKYKDEEFFQKIFDNAVEIGTDSRNINTSLIEKRTQIAINWKATAFWSENSKYIDIVNIDEKYAPRQKLIINLLSFSQNKDIAQAFIDFSISENGKKIMKKYGFL